MTCWTAGALVLIHLVLFLSFLFCWCLYSFPICSASVSFCFEALVLSHLVRCLMRSVPVNLFCNFCFTYVMFLSRSVSDTVGTLVLFDIVLYLTYNMGYFFFFSYLILSYALGICLRKESLWGLPKGELC